MQRHVSEEAAKQADDVRRVRDRGLGEATVEPDASGDSRIRRAFVGTSGWQYRHWRDRFYPAGMATTHWLAFYARSFRTVEVNASFYRLPSQETVRRWAASVPDDFVFAFKASRYLTHVRRLRDPEEPLGRMWEVFRAAGGKLGPVLFQLPPSFVADAPLLRDFLASLPPGMRAAFEFRHPSWFTADVIGLLDGSGSALVHADRPGTTVEPLPVARGWCYLRLHQGGRTSAGYAARKLRDYADAIAELSTTEVYAYFNNDAEGAAVRDASALIRLLADRGATRLPSAS
jgi:uncharacterized protein YecE (DUF72 family)